MASSVTVNAIGELRIEVEMLREQLALIKDERDNLRTERDRLLGVIETQAGALLPRGRKLVRDAGLHPSRQPQCEQDRAGKAACGLRRRHRREKPDHPSQVRPTSTK